MLAILLGLVKEGGATDDRGEYVLPLLESGRAYVVREEKREPRPVSGARSDPKKRKETFAPTFYPKFGRDRISRAIGAQADLPLALTRVSRRNWRR